MTGFPAVYKYPFWVTGKGFKGSVRIGGFYHVSKTVVFIGESSSFGIHCSGLVSVAVVFVGSDISHVVYALDDISCGIVNVMAGNGYGFPVFLPAYGHAGTLPFFVVGVGGGFPCPVGGGGYISKSIYGF